MKDRLKEVRKSLNLTMERFGEKLGVTRTAISNIENGHRSLTEQMFRSICREFNVNENWLRTGEGTMFNKESIDEEIAGFVGKTLSEEENSFKRSFILALSKLNADEWKMIENFIDEIKKNRAD